MGITVWKDYKVPDCDEMISPGPLTFVPYTHQFDINVL